MEDPPREHTTAAGIRAAIPTEMISAPELIGSLNEDHAQQASHSINQRIFDKSLDLILVVDSRGLLLRVSPSCTAILGYQPDEMTGRNAADFLHPDDLEATRREMRLGRRGQLSRHFDSRYLHKDGHAVPLSWTGVWSEPDRQHFFIGRDMTERLAAEERLRHAQRLEAMGRLTGGIAHDFNNFLTVVIGNLDLLQQEVSDRPVAIELVETALDACMRGAEITSQLLAFSRQQPLNPRPIDLNDLVGRTTRLLKRTIGERVRVRVAPAPDLSLAEADAAQVESALMNLAINARDAMPGGGYLTIETANSHLDEEYAEENTEVTPGDFVMLAVSDTGMGMPEAIRSRAFEPFFSTKGANGTGLGLSMVYGFAKQSRGHVKIYSEPGHGTTVRLYLPVSVRGAISPPPRALPVAEADLHGKTILVVEDNPGVRGLLLKQLDRLGYSTVEADDYGAALQILRRGEQVDLLFTDIVMPGGSGAALVAEARKLLPQLKVLLTSGFTQGGQPQESADSCYPFLSKPYMFHELALKLAEVLRPEQPTGSG